MASLELEARLDNLLSTAQAETANVDLFAPIPEKEECPICMITLPLKDTQGSIFHPCCGKIICGGCIYKSITRKVKDNGATKMEDFKCAFCRQKPPENDIKALKKLMKKKNPHAFMKMAIRYKNGDRGVLQSYTRALEMYLCAAELGNANAFENIGTCYYRGIAIGQDTPKALEFYDRARELGHTSACCNIGYAYSNGEGVDMDKKKAEHYWELAAMRGCEMARHNLGCMEKRAGNPYRAMKHFLLAARAGNKDSLDVVKEGFMHGIVTKDEYADTLRAYHKIQDEMKSDMRDKARDMV